MDQQTRELMETSYRYLLRLSDGISEEVKKRRSGNDKDFSVINLLGEGIQYLMKSIALTTDSNILDEETEIYKRIVEAFKELSNAISNSDHSLITDVLEHEFLPILEEWKGLLFNILADDYEGK